MEYKTEEDIYKRLDELKTEAAGFLEGSQRHQGRQVEIRKLERKLEKLNKKNERGHDWRMFYLSQIIPLAAILISIVALYKSSK